MIVDISLDYLNDGGNPVDKAILIGNIIEHCHYRQRGQVSVSRERA